MEKIINVDECIITDINYIDGKIQKNVTNQMNRSVSVVNHNSIAYADNTNTKDISIDGLISNAKENRNFSFNIDQLDTTPILYENTINCNYISMNDVIDFLDSLYDYSVRNASFCMTKIWFNFRIIELKKCIVSDFNRNEYYHNIKCELYVFIEKKTANHQYKVHDFFDGSFAEIVSNNIIYNRIDRLYVDLEMKSYGIQLMPDSYQCLVDPSFTGLLVHEVMGHVSEADTYIYRKQNGTIHTLFEQKYHHELNLIDFASEGGCYQLPSPVFMDNQTICAENVEIIKNGAFKDKLHSLETAALLNQTANGSVRTIYHNQAVVRMRNTILLPGTSKVQDMIGSIENGAYLCTPDKGIVDKNGNFAIEIVTGYVIHNGQIKQALDSSIAYGNITELLQSIDMVADNMRITGAFCNKGKESYVGMGGSALRCRLKISNRSSLR